MLTTTERPSSSISLVLVAGTGSSRLRWKRAINKFVCLTFHSRDWRWHQWRPVTREHDGTDRTGNYHQLTIIDASNKTNKRTGRMERRKEGLKERRIEQMGQFEMNRADRWNRRDLSLHLIPRLHDEASSTSWLDELAWRASSSS